MDCPQTHQDLSFLRAVRVAKPCSFAACNWTVQIVCSPSPMAVNRFFSQNSNGESSTDCPSVARHAGNLGNNYTWESPVSSPEETLQTADFWTKPLKTAFSSRQFCSRVWGVVRDELKGLEEGREGFASLLRRPKPKKLCLFSLTQVGEPIFKARAQKNILEQSILELWIVNEGDLAEG